MTISTLLSAIYVRGADAPFTVAVPPVKLMQDWIAWRDAAGHHGRLHTFVLPGFEEVDGEAACYPLALDPHEIAAITAGLEDVAGPNTQAVTDALLDYHSSGVERELHSHL